jgi:DNA-binding transcriptional ArsR family regulator
LNEDIQGQLESLLNEVRLLSSSFVHLRQDDFRVVFGEQIGPILKERVERFFDGLKKGPGDNHLKSSLDDLIEEYLSAFQQNGPGAAASLLDEFERSLPRAAFIKGVERTRFVTGLVGQMRDYLVLSERVSHRAEPDRWTIKPSADSNRSLSASAVEGVLAPLASARRVEILMMLSGDNDSLAGLSKRLSLKKGHLQFHLNVLVKAGHVIYDRKSHLYSISTKGKRALEGLAALVDLLA